MKGYKYLDEGLINQYGFQYEIGKTYHLNGELEWSKNGFHFCTKPENTLRYAPSKDSFTITEIEASGNIICGDDYGDNAYYDFDGLYASDTFKINRVLTRWEVIEMVVQSKNIDRINRLITLTKLNPDEIEYIKQECNDDKVNSYIEYYQYDQKDAFSKIIIK